MTRIYYSKDFKLQALLETENGTRLEDVLFKYGFNINEALKRDKKYCSKLLYKWRKELTKDGKFLNLYADKIYKSVIEYEIQNLNTTDEKDIIISDIKKKILQGSKKYKTLKTRIISAFTKKIKK